MSRRFSSPLLLAASAGALFMLACSSDDGGGSDTGNDVPGDPPMEGDPIVEDNLDPRNGYPFCPSSPSDMVEGEACSDEHGAVLCKVDTGYPGDELALCDRPTEALLLHYGPDPSQYDNPDAVAPFLMDPGTEDENCMFVLSPNEQDAFLTNYHGRLRPQSHHLIVTTLEGSPEAGPNPVQCTPLFRQG